jgi:hypothetical protein
LDVVDFVKKYLAVHEDEHRDSVSFLSGLKLVFTYGPYVKAALTFLFLTMAAGVSIQAQGLVDCRLFTECMYSFLE